ncbi:MAG: nucleotidyltransferase domain-containing protein [Terracidiphilus sp.]|jgi:hypothetical protein
MVPIPIPETEAVAKLPVVAARRSGLAELCQRFHVCRLELFGSAVSGAFDPEQSDLDFLVQFGPLEASEYADAFLGFKEALEQLFGRSVDLVVPSAIRNPYFLESVERGKALLYAA